MPLIAILLPFLTLYNNIINMTSKVSSGRLYILGRVAELAQRQGLHPLEADATLQVVGHDAHKNPIEVLELDDLFCSEQNRPKFEKMIGMLGCDESGVLKGDTLRDIAQAVERAIALSPRARSRG